MLFLRGKDPLFANAQCAAGDQTHRNSKINADRDERVAPVQDEACGAENGSPERRTDHFDAYFALEQQLAVLISLFAYLREEEGERALLDVDALSLGVLCLEPKQMPTENEDRSRIRRHRSDNSPNNLLVPKFAARADAQLFVQRQVSQYALDDDAAAPQLLVTLGSTQCTGFAATDRLRELRSVGLPRPRRLRRG